MATGTVNPGERLTVNIGTNTGKLRTVVTLAGRASTRVQILARENGAASASAGSGGDNEINMSIESTLTIEGASIDDVVIDDSANKGQAPLTYTITQYSA
ncbi:MAG TPA: hypothetical protein VIZ65_01205 [Cellvibrionaceae bacterium]